MENLVTVFSNEQFGNIRIAMSKNNEPLFCLADVCKSVGLINPSTVKKRLDPQDLQLIDLHALQQTEGAIVGNSMANFITENGFYDVLLYSDAPQVKPFRKWVTSEVLPSIRKHGAYITNQTIEKALSSPDFLIELATKLKEQQKLNHTLNTQMRTYQSEHRRLLRERDKLMPKVEYHDTIISSKGYLTINMIAASLNITDIRLNKLLCEWDIQYKQSGTYFLFAKYRDKGYTVHKPHPYTDSTGEIKTRQHMYWTEAGKKFIIKQYNKKFKN